MSSESSTPVASTSASALASATTSEASFSAGPTAGAAKATAKKVKEKKNVNVDPELIRRRREEKAVARQKAADAEEQAKANGEIPPEKLQFIARELVDVSGAHANGQSDKQTLTIMTWNLLAQGLVRRTLFPGSDLLKWKDRGAILTQQFLHYAPTIACLQEVDRLDHHEPVFRKSGYDFVWQKGYAAKLHGLCIAWKENIFEKAAEKLVKLDDATFDPRPDAQGNSETRGASVSKRTACSRATRNTGLFVALRWRNKRTEGQPQGVIVVTHHLFWHARHQYERARQVAVLLREIDLFRQNEDNGQYQDWPCFFAGDFNIQPSEGTYRLMTGAALSAAQEDTLQLSTVVHKTLDDYNYKLREAERLGQQGVDDQGNEDEDDEDRDDTAGATNPTGEVYAQPEGDEDRVLKNTRPARDSDGLLSLDEIKSVYEKHRNNMWSLYGQYYGTIKDEAGNWFGERDGPKEEVVDEKMRERRITEGYYEPAWTNVTPLWRCTLDYIFYIPPPAVSTSEISVKKLLRTHRLADLEPGLPRMNKEPSDHVALMAEIEI